MQTVKIIVKESLHGFYEDYLEGLRADERQGLDVIQAILDSGGQGSISEMFPEDTKDITTNFEALKQE